MLPRRNADKSRTVAYVMRKVIIWFACMVAASLLAAAAIAGRLYWEIAKDLPDHRLASETSSWSGCVPSGSKHQFVPLTDIPADAVNAFVAAEQPDFFDRPAFSPLTEVIGAIRGIQRQRTGSILAAMYARALFACHRSVPSHGEWHFKFALLTYRVERDLPRRNILETVINTLYFGRGSFGIAAGAEAYFHKPLNALSLAEMASLGGVIKEPSRYDESRAHAETFLLERRSRVLDRMAGMGAISSQQAEAAKFEPLGVQQLMPVSKKEP
jgi:penicillin-binding protein 1A